MPRSCPKLLPPLAPAPALEPDTPWARRRRASSTTAPQAAAEKPHGERRPSLRRADCRRRAFHGGIWEPNVPEGEVASATYQPESHRRPSTASMRGSLTTPCSHCRCPTIPACCATSLHATGPWIAPPFCSAGGGCIRRVGHLVPLGGGGGSVILCTATLPLSVCPWIEKSSHVGRRLPGRADDGCTVVLCGVRRESHRDDLTTLRDHL